jgi:transcriptional regulator with XRE-family HTH domain
MSPRWGLEMRVMTRDNSNDNTLAFPVLSIFRGLYQRVAAKLGVDPSYVSRVARGERQSAAVLAALQEEMDVIRQHLNNQTGQLPNGKRKDGELQNGKLQNGKTPDGLSSDANVRNGTQRDGQRAAGKTAKGKPGSGSRRTSTGASEAKAAD